MIQIVSSLTDPIVIAYNIGMVLIFLVWIYQDKLPMKQILLKGRLLYWYIFSFSWLIFSVFANFLFLGSDVDDAIISGTKAFVNTGVNPYANKVVVHLLNNEVVLGLYHYFPSDLFAYSFIYTICKPFLPLIPHISLHFFSYSVQLNIALENSWFVFGNFVFLTIAYFFVKKILDPVEHKRLVPIYIFITAFFLFTNSSLLVLYFAIGFYLLKKSLYSSGITAYVLAAGVKYITGLLLFVQIVEEMLMVRKVSDLKFLKPYIIGSVVFIVLIIPFHIDKVLNATFLYQLEVNSRSEVAGIYGPALIEIVLQFGLLDYFSIIFIISCIISIYVAFRYGKSTYEREMILSFLFMFILPFYGTELFIVPLFLWLFKLFDVELNFPDTSSYFKENKILSEQ